LASRINSARVKKVGEVEGKRIECRHTRQVSIEIEGRGNTDALAQPLKRESITEFFNRLPPFSYTSTYLYLLMTLSLASLCAAPDGLRSATTYEPALAGVTFGTSRMALFPTCEIL